MGGLAEDLRNAARQVRRRPAFAFIVVLTLGSAMGVSTAMFAMLNGWLFRPWDVRDPGRVVAIPRGLVSEHEAEVWAAQSRSFSGMAARRIAISRDGLAGRMVAYDFVTPNYFDVLGVPFARGRGFSPDAAVGDVVEAVLSDRTWRNVFAADPEIVGRRFSLQERPAIVAGVLPPGFEGVGPSRQHLWVPMSARSTLEKAGTARPATDAGGDVQVIGRLKQGVSAAGASAEIAAISARYHAEAGGKVFRVPFEATEGIAQNPVGSGDAARLSALLLAIVFLNFIACANVSNLFLARGYSRRGEFAARLALGASRTRLVRQLLVEALLLAGAAGLVGVAVSTVLPAHMFASVPDAAEIIRIDARPDLRVFGWMAALATVVCLFFGLGPALRSTKISVSQVLKDGHGEAPSALKTSLPALQAMVSVFALAVAGFVLRSAPQEQARKVAKAVDGLSVVRVTHPAAFDATRRDLIARDLLNALRPPSSSSALAAADREPRPSLSEERQTAAVSPSYFATLRMPLIAGRTFEERADRDAVVVNESLARSEWGEIDVVGRRLKLPGVDGAAREVIGVVRDGMHASPTWFTPLDPAQIHVIYVADTETAVRLRATRLSFAGGVGPALQVVGGSDWIRHAFPGQAFGLRLFSEFGLFALALSILGLFGLSDYAIRQRTREIGLRAVLGASPARILEVLLRPALRALAIGTAAGLALGVAVAEAMRRLQLPEGVRPIDGVLFASVAVVMVLAGVAALAWPARRALLVAPAEALRYE